MRDQLKIGKVLWSTHDYTKIVCLIIEKKSKNKQTKNNTYISQPKNKNKKLGIII